MKELDKLNTRSRTGTCLPTSSVCVKWEGPTIPCLTICKGESIEQVIVDLASIVCTTKDSIDISSLNFSCLVPNGQSNPATIKQLLQLLITKSCQTSTVDPGTGGGDGTLPVLDLPACLQYQDSQLNIITSLGLDEYAEYLATSICDVKDEVSNINQQIININSTISTLQTGGGSGSGGSGSATVTVISKCLSSSQPGATVPLATAFQTLEESLCEDYLTPMTTPGQISQFNLAASLCPTKDTLTPCGGKYGDISGWIQNPVTSFEHLKNMALAICKLDECAKYAPTGVCVALPPVDIQITNLSTTGCYIKWTNPLSYTNIDLDDPVEIRFEFYHPSNLTTPITLAAGPNSGTGTQTFISFQPSAFNTNNNLVNAAFLPSVEYVIRGYAVYTQCGKSLTFAEKKSKVKESNSDGMLYYKLSEPVQTSKSCNGLGGATAYVESKRTIRIELRNPVTNQYVVNTNSASAKISAKFHIYYTNPCNEDSNGDPIVEIQTITVEIPHSGSFGEKDFVESEKIACNLLSTCKSASRVIKCLVEVKMSNGTPLTTGIGLHPTFTSALPMCP
jgi:hypothetical protein